MSQSFIPVLPYDQPSGARRRWFAWRPAVVTLLLVLAALAAWRALPHIVRVQGTIGAEPLLIQHVPWIQSTRWMFLAGLAAGPLIIGVFWGLGEHAAPLRALRRPIVWGMVSLPMLATGVMAYVTFWPLLRLDRELSVPYPHQAESLPIQFRDSRELFTHLAYLAGENVNARSVVGFTAGCVIDRNPEDGDGCWVIAPTYDANGRWSVRGAQGNGAYYIVRPHPVDDIVGRTGFDLVGILAGNSYTFRHGGKGWTVEAYWHMSASEGHVELLQWDGRAFRDAGGWTQTYAEDGNIVRK